MKYAFLFIFAFSLLACGRQDMPTSRDPRIITTYRPATHLVAAIRMEKYLVGVHTNAMNLPLFTHLQLPVQEIPSVGDKAHGINFETLLGCKPTFVVLFPGNMGLQTQQRLADLKIESEIINIESLKEIQNSMTKLAVRLGVPENAKTAIAEMDRILALVEKGLARRTGQEKLSLYCASSSSFLNTHSQEMLQHEMIETAGLKDVVNVSHGGWFPVSLEQLLVWNPDIIVISGSASYSLESVYSDERFRNLKAVQNKKVYEMPESRLCVWDFPGPDSVLGILWMARLAYPSCFENLAWEEEVEKYYSRIYQISYKEIIAKSKK